MKVRILRPALEDLAAGRHFYDQQSAGVGDYFFDSLFADIDALALYGGIHSLHLGMYRSLAKRFPYVIYYRIINEEVVVYRVLDGRRNPRWIRQALKDS
ncbi:MAG: type II toxin-antitoxin system RelE/ParE family toxin [Verrucomicrobiota bacterium]